MKTCIKCGTQFKTCAVIDGRVIKLGTRSQCLTCLPYRPRVFRDLHAAKIRCPHCARKRSRNDFYIDAAGKPYSWCRQCVNERKVTAKQRFKRACIAYKGGACEVCGYAKCDAALDFHHNDASQKDFGISDSGHCCLTDEIKKELDKCRLLCANCHRELHFELSLK